MSSQTKYQRILKSDVQYPRRLKRVKDAPDFLYVDGFLELPNLSVGIVGARAALRANKELAYRLSALVAKRKGCVISGGAIGIDTSAHLGALENHGKTILIAAFGLDHVYPPRNKTLFDSVKAHGAVVSEYHDSKPPLRWQFVKRNRLIAALSDWLVVVQAKTKSGSLHTAEYALEYGKKLAAVPGSPGCDQLIRAGAVSIENVNDFCDVLDKKSSPKNRSMIQLGAMEKNILVCLEKEGMWDIADLHKETGYPSDDICAALAMLELEGLALEKGGNHFTVLPKGKEWVKALPCG